MMGFINESDYNVIYDPNYYLNDFFILKCS
jgi:hypothetical protein